MKKISYSSAALLFVFSSFAQNNPIHEILVRHDTTTLKADECEWIIKPRPKTGETGNSVPFVILQAIQKGTLRAVDPLTGLQIPANEIFFWRMTADTVAEIDEGKNTPYKIVRAKHNPDQIPLIRICQDWYFDIQSGMFRSEIKWIELLEEVKSASGYFIGLRPLCRIYY